MSIFAAYALMLLVPVLLTVAIIGLPALLGDIVPVPRGLGAFVFFALLPALAIVGAPYMVMSIGLVFWARGRPAPAIRRAVNLAPVILWLLVVLWSSSTIWRIRVPENPLGIRKPLELFGWISALVLGLGYFWVLLAHVVVRWLRHHRFVVDAA